MIPKGSLARERYAVSWTYLEPLWRNTFYNQRFTRKYEFACKRSPGPFQTSCHDFVGHLIQSPKPSPAAGLFFAAAASSNPPVARGTRFAPNSIADALDILRLRLSARLPASSVKTCASCEAREIETYAKRLFINLGGTLVSIFTKGSAVIWGSPRLRTYGAIGDIDDRNGVRVAQAAERRDKKSLNNCARNNRSVSTSRFVPSGAVHFGEAVL
jgi:hypothetical protein